MSNNALVRAITYRAEKAEEQVNRLENELASSQEETMDQFKRAEKAEARVKELEDFRIRYCKLQESLGDILPQWQLDSVIADFKKRTEKGNE